MEICYKQKLFRSQCSFIISNIYFQGHWTRSCNSTATIHGDG